MRTRHRHNYDNAEDNILTMLQIRKGTKAIMEQRKPKDESWDSFFFNQFA